jgi:hypothetical protein
MFEASVAIYRACCALPAAWWASEDPVPVDDMLAFARKLTDIPDEIADEIWLERAEAMALRMREEDGGVRAQDVAMWVAAVLQTEADTYDELRRFLRSEGAGEKPRPLASGPGLEVVRVGDDGKPFPPAEAQGDGPVEIPMPVRAPVRKPAARRRYSRDISAEEIPTPASIDAALLHWQVNTCARSRVCSRAAPGGGVALRQLATS